MNDNVKWVAVSGIALCLAGCATGDPQRLAKPRAAGDWEAAVAQCQQAVTREPENQELVNRLAEARREAAKVVGAKARQALLAKRLNEAATLSEKALAYDPLQEEATVVWQVAQRELNGVAALRETMEKAATAGDFAAAMASLRGLEARQTDWPDLAARRTELGGKAAARELEEVKKALADNRINDAETALRAAQAYADTPPVREAQRAIAQRRQCLGLTGQVFNLRQDGNLPAALTQARAAQEADPTFEPAKSLCQEVARQLAEQKLAAARNAIEEQRFTSAFALVEEAKACGVALPAIQEAAEAARKGVARQCLEMAARHAEAGQPGNACWNSRLALRQEATLEATAAWDRAAKAVIESLPVALQWGGVSAGERLTAAGELVSKLTLEKFAAARPAGTQLAEAPPAAVSCLGTAKLELLSCEVTSVSTQDVAVSTYQAGTMAAMNPVYQSAARELDQVNAAYLTTVAAAAKAEQQWGAAHEAALAARDGLLKAQAAVQALPEAQRGAASDRVKAAQEQLDAAVKNVESCGGQMSQARKLAAEKAKDLAAAQQRLAATPAQIQVPDQREHHYPVIAVTQQATCAARLTVTRPDGSVWLSAMLDAAQSANDKQVVADAARNVKEDPLQLPDPEQARKEVAANVAAQAAAKVAALLQAERGQWEIRAAAALANNDRGQAIECLARAAALNPQSVKVRELTRLLLAGDGLAVGAGDDLLTAAPWPKLP